MKNLLSSIFSSFLFYQYWIFDIEFGVDFFETEILYQKNW